MGQSLKGRTALVTGSTSGIGQGIIEVYAAEGANVVLNGFGESGAIEELRRKLARHGVKVEYDGADMSKAAEIEAMMRRVGDIDILVNNAGIQFVSPVESFPPDRWDAIIAINLTAAFHTTRLAIPAMKAKRWGRVINIASAHGLVASPNKSAYVAAKHGIIGFTKTVALEVAEHGITANSICPGFVYTPLVEKQIQDRARERNITPERAAKDVILAPQPSKEFVKIEEIAAMALYLATPAAASINGAAMSIDGGWTAH
ncbi:MAG TPA: 3-hydroxybutyrate dehydrogenase [Usitatibacter sp.]|nr:3-hydroxybutyrate dehydrogenase [Usitatibacter sp.]